MKMIGSWKRSFVVIAGAFLIACAGPTRGRSARPDAGSPDVGAGSGGTGGAKDAASAPKDLAASEPGTAEPVSAEAGGARPDVAPDLTVSTSALMAHWKLDEMNSDSASDSSGNGHQGRLVNF